MKRPRSALPLPRYVLRKRLKDAWGYFFNVPTWARVAGCPVKNEPLGTDYDAAVRRAETVLLPSFDSWLSDGASDEVQKIAISGPSIGFSPNTAPIDASPSWTRRLSAFMNQA
jgi:hypothetical protein